MKRWYLVFLVIGCFAVGSATTFWYFDSRDYRVDGQIFRLDREGHVQSARGAAIHVFRLAEGTYFEPDAEVSRLQRSDKSDKDCAEIAAALQRQYADTVSGVDPRLMSDETGNSSREEWEHIKLRQEFMHLADSKKQLVKRAFWLRRGIHGEGDEQELTKLWQTLFQEEIGKGLKPAKADLEDQTDWLTERHLAEGIVVEHADSDGHFSLALEQGSYLLVATGKVPEVYYWKFLGKTQESQRLRTAVWVETIRVPRQGNIVMAEPLCQPSPEFDLK